MMNKLFARRTLLLCAQHQRLALGLQSLPTMRTFHAGHNHNHDDDGKESHSDFKAKSKVPLSEEQLNAQFSQWIKENDIVLFMKGSKKMPRCGFSNYAVQVLKFYGLNNWKDVDVLADEQLREGIKKYSNWPTIPQLYVKG